MKDFFSIYDCNIVELQKNHNRLGNITYVENEIDVPFKVERLYYLFDVPGGQSRGGHAHKSLRQLMVAASGSFDVSLDDGRVKKVVQLNQPNIGLLIMPGIWRELTNFSSGGICLVLASERYDSEDYIRDYADFIRLRTKNL